MTENHLPAEVYCTTDETADILHCSRRKLERDRMIGEGIPFVRFGGQILYRRSDIDSFLASCRVTSTSEYPLRLTSANSAAGVAQ